MRVRWSFLIAARSRLEKEQGGGLDFCIPAMIPTVENDVMVFT